mgnify:CR=1 FL=1
MKNYLLAKGEKKPSYLLFISFSQGEESFEGFTKSDLAKSEKELKSLQNQVENAQLAISLPKKMKKLSHVKKTNKRPILKKVWDTSYCIYNINLRSLKIFLSQLTL